MRRVAAAQRVAGVACFGGVLLAATGCDSHATGWDPPTEAQLAIASESASSVSVRTTSNREQIDFSVNGVAVRGRFRAHFGLRAGRVQGSIVAAWEGTTTESAIRVETEIVSMSLRGQVPSINWAGRARYVDLANGHFGPWVDVVGTARPDAEAPDCVIFDIVGSGVHIVADAPATIRIKE